MENQSLVNSTLQIQGILHNPISFLNAFTNSLSVNNFYIESMIGVLGWFNYTYQPIVYTVYFLIFGYAIREIISYKKKIFPSYVTLILFLICCSSLILPFLAMYLMWTPVGYSQVLGVQGRYFLPLFPFILLIIHQLFISADKKKIEMFLMWGFIFFISSQSLMTIYLRYYREEKKENDLASFIKYDPTKIKYMPVNKQISFGFEMNGEKKKITGFQFYFTSHDQKIEVPYHYKFMDESCAKTYREGDLDMKKLQGDSIYQQEFPHYDASGQNVCLILEPASFSAGDHYFSIITDDQSPKIELLGAGK